MLRSALHALRSTKAVSAAEYAILAVAIVVMVGVAAKALAPKLEAAFSNIGDKIGGTAAPAPAAGS